jgi:hypothetical protein
MKQPSVEWLLDPRDPFTRFHALVDLLGRSANDKDVVAKGERIRNYGPVKRIMAAQTREDYRPPKETYYRPKWTAAAWPLTLLGEMEHPPITESRESASGSSIYTKLTLELFLA